MSIIEIFRAGTHRAMSGASHTFTEQDLDDAVQAYSAQLRPAPLVLGHPRVEDETHGTVSRLFRKGKSLFAECKNVSASLKGWVQAGCYKKISASFFLPGSPDNPRPGSIVLKHVGFLGAMPPAVKGLADPTFAEAENILCFADDYDSPPAYFMEEPGAPDSMSNAEVAERARAFRDGMADQGRYISYAEAVDAVTGRSPHVADIGYQARAYRDRMAEQGRYLSYTEAVDAVAGYGDSAGDVGRRVLEALRSLRPDSAAR